MPSAIEPKVSGRAPTAPARSVPDRSDRDERGSPQQQHRPPRPGTSQVRRRRLTSPPPVAAAARHGWSWLRRDQPDPSAQAIPLFGSFSGTVRSADARSSPPARFPSGRGRRIHPRRGRNLGYTPSAISQHLTALQKETGLTLVDGPGRGIEPRAPGPRLRRRVRRRAGTAGRAGIGGDRPARGPRRPLPASYFASAGAALMPPVVAALSSEFPQLRLDLRLIEMAQSSFAPDVEVFVEPPHRHGSRATTSGRWSTTPMWRSCPTGTALGRRCRAVGRPARRGVGGERPRPRPVPPDRAGRLRRSGFTPTFQIEAQDYPSAIAFVAAGIGITVVPRLAALALPAGVRALPVIDPAPQRRIQVRARRAVNANPVVARTLELLRGHSRLVARAGAQ